jgi:recombination protein RecA
VTKRGAFFSYGESKLGQGRENAKEFLKQNPELLAQIEDQIRANAVQATEAIIPNDNVDGEPGEEDEAETESEIGELETEAVAEAA